MISRDDSQSARDNSQGQRAQGDGSRDAHKSLEAAITRALETTPPFAVPADFASRVAASALAESPRRRSPWRGFGPRIALGSGGLLTVALFALAPHTTPSVFDLRFDLELLILLELGGIGWLAGRLASAD